MTVNQPSGCPRIASSQRARSRIADGDAEGEDRAPVGSVAGPHPAAVRFDEGFDDVKAQPGVALPRTVPEPREDHRPEPLRDPLPFVSHRDETRWSWVASRAIGQVDGARLDSHGDLPGTVRERVVDEVDHDLVDPVRVGPPVGDGATYDDLDPLGRDPEAAQPPEVLGHDRVQEDLLATHLHPAGLDPGDIEQVGDQPGHAVRVGLDGLDDEPLLLIGEPVPAPQQGRGEAFDRGQRRAQLVRERRQQRRMVALGPLAGHRAAQGNDHPLDRLPRGRTQVAGRGQHLDPVAGPEQLLPVALDRVQGRPRVGDVPPGAALRVPQRQGFADRSTDAVTDRRLEDLFGAQVGEGEKAPPVNGNQAVGQRVGNGADDVSR